MIVDTLKITYHSLLGSHLLYSCHLWGQKNETSLNRIQILQNRALQKTTFKKRHDPANSICQEFHILKFNCLFVLQID